MVKLVVILGFVLSFAAGLVVGSRWSGLSDGASAGPQDGGKAPTTGPSQRRGPGSWLAQELGLTSEQRAKLDEIWSAVAKKGRDDRDDQRRQYRRERDAAIADLIEPARMGEYDQILDVYAERIEEMERESREAYEQAVEQTKQILTPPQRTRYEELLKRHRWGPGARDRHSNRRGETRATSGPTEPSPSHDRLKGAP